MAIVKCLECSKEISTDSKSCPHCGATRLSSVGRPPEMIALIRIMGIILIIAGLGFTYHFYNHFQDTTVSMIIVIIGISLLIMKINKRK